MVRFGDLKVPNLTIAQFDLDRFGTWLGLGNRSVKLDYYPINLGYG